ncbi:hypothetical protein QAD02_018180 [Eretmocerus hayati]|uniref:Uncharacterized protein n=1 Tax=Eretmocerus hayati TaxID=131215 RepID=A0ACC2PG04_9HYME|nr:hypothetical protein QAD02_018180 [Eretmocerus hayati]
MANKESCHNYKCSVPGCGKNSIDNPELTFHTFPSPRGVSVYVADCFGNQRKVDRLEAWLHVLKIKKLIKGKKVCSSHFRKEDYAFPDIQYSKKRPLLMKNAVPSCNLPCSNPEQRDRDALRLTRRLKREKCLKPAQRKPDYNVSGKQKASLTQQNDMVIDASADTCAGQVSLLASSQKHGHHGQAHLSDHNYNESIDHLIQHNDTTADGSISAYKFDTNIDPTQLVSVVMNEHSSESPIVLNNFDPLSLGNTSKYNCGSEQPTCEDQANDSVPIQVPQTSTDKIVHEQSAIKVESQYSFISVLKNRVQLSTATGIESFQELHAIVEAMKAATGFKYESDSVAMKTKERVIMTYVKLKQNISYSFLSLLFPQISERHCARIFQETVKLLASFGTSYSVGIKREMCL